jgi:cellulose synthase/poly-beta-1,6-N-acetylglucosamine synthase-like glycosyltransferase
LETTIQKTQDEDRRNKKHSTICVGNHHTKDSRRRQTKQKTQHNMCWTPPCLHLYSFVWWFPTHIVLCFLFRLSSSWVFCMVVYNTYCVMFFVSVFVLSLLYGGFQHILCYVFCFVCLHLESFVWWFPTHIVLCFLFLSSSWVFCMVVSNTYCVMFFVSVFVLSLLTPPYKRLKMKTDETKNIAQYVLETTIQKTQDEDWRNKKHNTICVGNHCANKHR